ncbi:MAG TPA: Clp protease N-terminal domain-containing protein [Candidatus Limnocylindrales bacterium]|nr:Clp protease N-terminal domain-containing protein [Candidatus Limnocylindrales bacterium]
MNELRLLSAFVQGLVAGVVALVVIALAAAVQSRAGVTFAELLTAFAISVAVGAVSFLLPRIVEWQVRRSIGRGAAGSFAVHAVFGSGGPAGGAIDPPDAGDRGTDRFDRFSDRARRVLTLAQDEAQRFNHAYIGTEHILLGLVREGDGVAAGVLTSMGIDLVKVRTAVEFIVGRGDRPVVGEVGLTPGAKRAIELAIDEARVLGHRHIGTGHLLLGLVRAGDGMADEVLASFGVTLERTRTAVLAAIGDGKDAER